MGSSSTYFFNAISLIWLLMCASRLKLNELGNVFTKIQRKVQILKAYIQKLGSNCGATWEINESNLDRKPKMKNQERDRRNKEEVTGKKSNLVISECRTSSPFSSSWFYFCQKSSLIFDFKEERQGLEN